MNRAEILATLRSHPEVSVLIVGAGINGVGTFRDLALNGVDVLLIDRSDFCSGTSAASSHMAHGGIRYLENGEFRLVREAVQERNRLIRNAPHLVRPLPTTIPIFRTFSGLLNAPLKFAGLLDRPSERGAIVIKIGLVLYDAYTGRDRIVPRHRLADRIHSLQRWPDLNPAITHTATYYDGAILQPERLAIELILDAESENASARALNYVGLVGSAADGVVLRDELTGAQCIVRPRLVVNAAGPWIDHTNRLLGIQTRFIGGTKGSHLVLDHPQLRRAIGDHEFFFENSDGRIVLIFPLYDRVLIGTSDIPAESPDDVLCTEDEVDYFLQMIDRVFPSIRVGREQIVFRFSGVRPLAAGKSKAAAQITRDHEIRILSPSQSGFAFPVYSLVGGKWTSYRAFSEQVTDMVLAFLGSQRISSTRDLPVGGARGYPTAAKDRRDLAASIAAVSGLPVQRVEGLVDRYGARGSQMAQFIRGAEDRPLDSAPQYSAREVSFLARREKVVHLDDLLLRRSMLAMLGCLTRPTVDEIAAAVAEQLDWSDDRRETEIARFSQIMLERHQVKL